MTLLPTKWWLVLHPLKRVSLNIAQGWIYRRNRSPKISLIEPHGNHNGN